MPLPNREELESRYGQMVAEQQAREAAAAQQIGQTVGGAVSGFGTGLMDQVRAFKQYAESPLTQNYVRDLLTMNPRRSGYTELAEMGKAAIDPQTYKDLASSLYQQATESPESFGRLVGQNVNPLRVLNAKPVMSEINVYHGSPHKFEAFDASKIGTGEGAQAYGHGIYLAEQKDVADMYRRALTPHKVSDDDAQSLASYAMRQRHNKDDAIKWLQKEKTAYKSEQSPETLAQYDAAINVLQGGNVPKVGNLYTADLPDPMVDRMLDWDKPLSEQHPDVQKAFGFVQKEMPKLPAPVKTGSTNPDWQYSVAGFPAAPTPEKAMQNAIDSIKGSQNYVGISGAEAYKQLASKYANKKNPLAYDEASAVLRAAGIPGIRYLDAGSRGQGGTGTRNFVVFPGEETKVKILKRE